MKIKTKLSFGIGILFLLILLMLAGSLKYIRDISKDTKNILVANYNTLDYSRNMLISLDELPGNASARKIFLQNLLKQKNNITEPGEKETTLKLEQDFNSFLSSGENKTILQIRNDIYQLMELNMRAIERKSTIAQGTANNAYTWISFSGAICFLIAFSLFISFPGSIAGPIKILADSIKEISNKNYSLYLNFESHDEFGEVAVAFNKMAAKLKEYEKSNISQLLFEKKRIETLINNMNDPIIGLDENNNIVFVNEQALEILGLKKDDIIGKPALDIALKNDLMRSLTKDILSQEASPEHVKQKDFRIYSNNKECYFEKEIIDISSIPTGEKVSKQIGHVIILKNVTSFKELDVLKTNFISTVSHELKTPLSSILISLNLLEDERVGTVNKEQSQLIQNIREDGERLLKITSELLNMTQAETGMVQLNIQACDPKEIVLLAINANKMQAEQNKTDIEYSIADTAELVNADKEKTAWVLTNFISNAIRYSPQESKIIISVSKENRFIHFAVQDFGKGIDDKYKDRIFDRYFRVPGSDKEGTGLGLAICKEFIEAQNGSIGVSSEINKGSTFYFKLESKA